MAVFAHLLPSMSLQTGQGAGSGDKGQMQDSRQKRPRTGPSPTQQGKNKGKPKGRGKQRTAADQDQDMDDSLDLSQRELLRLIATLVLQQHDQALRTQLDTGFLLTLKNDLGPECMLPVMQKVAKAWVQMKEEEPTKLDMPLRTTLLICMFQELKSRAELLQADAEAIEKATQAGWLNSSREWICQKWDVDTETMVEDKTRPCVTMEAFLGQVVKLQGLVAEVANVPRFQATRPLAKGNITGHSLAFLLDVSLRTQADPLYEQLKSWDGLAALNLIGARLRPMRLKRSPAANKLQKWLSGA